TRTPSEMASAKFQQAVVETHPNVSIVDLTMILETVDDILGKVSFVIQFMALFSILTGLLVLIGSVIISKFQRVKESVLLRTLGASRRQILSINALEYFFLGSLASFVGILLAIAGSWGLATYSFKTPFTPDWTPVIATFFIITILTVILGMLNSRDILNRPPLEVLRMQVG
ncbi:MAG: FtsX-like permease family protein, partial [Chitinophagales bacterium]